MEEFINRYSTCEYKGPHIYNRLKITTRVSISPDKTAPFLRFIIFYYRVLVALDFIIELKRTEPMHIALTYRSRH